MSRVRYPGIVLSERPDMVRGVAGIGTHVWSYTMRHKLGPRVRTGWRDLRLLIPTLYTLSHNSKDRRALQLDWRWFNDEPNMGVWVDIP